MIFLGIRFAPPAASLYDSLLSESGWFGVRDEDIPKLSLFDRRHSAARHPLGCSEINIE
jgi:hypothetical protein